MHTEIPVKVNAWVDEGVAPLILALNEFADLVTLDSCQGDQDRPAYVYFRHRGTAAETVQLVTRLAEALYAAAAGCDYTFRVEWLAGGNEPMAELMTSPHSIGQPATALGEVVSAFRKTQRTCGT
jgi:hypothetical protein